MRQKRKYTDTEKLFKDDFRENANLLLKGAIFLQKEAPLYKAMEVLKREFYEENIHHGSTIVGRIDLLFQWRGVIYLAEVKYQRGGNSDFWDAMKVMGYKELYKWQHNTCYTPAIMMPLGKIKLEHKIVTSNLKIALFGIEIKKGKFNVIPINFNTKESKEFDKITN